MTGKEAKRFFREFANKQFLLAKVSSNLTRKQREIIKLVDIEGLTLDEASDELAMSTSALKKKRNKAYTVIGALLEEDILK